MTEKKYLTKGQMIDMADRVYEDVLIPEWKNQYVCVQSLTAAEKDQFESGMTQFRQIGNRMVATPNLVNMRARLVAMCVVDPQTHERVFGDGDVPELGRKSAAALDRIVEACKRLSRWSDNDLEKMALELKNDPPAASPTD